MDDETVLFLSEYAYWMPVLVRAIKMDGDAESAEIEEAVLEAVKVTPQYYDGVKVAYSREKLLKLQDALSKYVAGILKDYRSRSPIAMLEDRGNTMIRATT